MIHIKYTGNCVQISINNIFGDEYQAEFGTGTKGKFGYWGFISTSVPKAWAKVHAKDTAITIQAPEAKQDWTNVIGTRFSYEPKKNGKGHCIAFKRVIKTGGGKLCVKVFGEWCIIQSWCAYPPRQFADQSMMMRKLKKWEPDTQYKGKCYLVTLTDDSGVIMPADKVDHKVPSGGHNEHYDVFDDEQSYDDDGIYSDSFKSYSNSAN